MNNQGKEGIWQQVIGLVLLSLVLSSGCGSVITPLPNPTVTPASEVEGTIATPTPAPGTDVVPRTPIPSTPTFTPTPSPTPVIHIVESGDTLFGIAIEYGVTTEAIQEVNGVDNPNALSIGQSLIIPLDREEAAAQPVSPLQDSVLLPTPTPVPLVVQGLALYPTAVGGVWCMGEVRNTLETPVTNLHVKVTLVDSLGTPLVSDRTLAAADYLPAGKAAPFAVLFGEEVPEDADIQVELLRAEHVSAITAAFVPLKARETSGAFAGPQYRVSGKILNDSGAAIVRAVVVVTLYDQEGSVLAYRQAILESGVAPDSQIPFALLLTPRGDTEPAAFQVLTWGDTTG